MTHEERDRLLTDDGNRLDIAERDLTKARSVFDIRLQHAETDDIRAALESHHLPDLEKQETAVAEAAHAIYARADAIMKASSSNDPVMTAAEMSEAASHFPFVAERCKSWPLDDLIEAVRHSVVSGNRGLMFAYREALPARLKPPAVTPGVYTQPHDPAARDRAELHRLLSVINDRLRDPRYERLRKQAVDMKIRAGDLKRKAEQRKANLNRDSYPWQSANEVRWNRDRK
jgi:hypothetical protein